MAKTLSHGEITISQAESKRAVALLAHLRQVFRAVRQEDWSVPRPIDLDHAEVLLASASLRALLFDDSPSPQLVDFSKKHGLSINIETISTTSAMLLFSAVGPGNELHLSDLIANILLDPAVRGQFKENEPNSFVAILQDDCDIVKQIGSEQSRWVPFSRTHLETSNSSVGYQPGTGICQYANITRKHVTLEKWGLEVVGVLGDIPIRRRNIVEYVANKLGGVHYDSRRFPAKEADKREFKALAESYDWNAQAVVHAGLVLVFLSCLELARNELIINLMFALERFHITRQGRLRTGGELPAAG